ncbi:MAG: synthase subunit epsilon [Bacteroidota bacterium]|jgi:F-type H+-transporting ATPase subunit epsilon
MFVELLTPDNTLFSGDAEVITLPGVNGSFQLMENHAPMIANLKSGSIEIKDKNETQTFEIKSGLVEVLKNKVVVLV